MTVVMRNVVFRTKGDFSFVCSGMLFGSAQHPSHFITCTNRVYSAHCSSSAVARRLGYCRKIVQFCIEVA